MAERSPPWCAPRRGCDARLRCRCSARAPLRSPAAAAQQTFTNVLITFSDNVSSLTAFADNRFDNVFLSRSNTAIDRGSRFLLLGHDPKPWLQDPRKSIPNYSVPCHQGALFAGASNKM